MLSDGEHNYYGTRVDAHFQDSYWNCIIETNLSLEDDLPGVFITEKTFKAIAYAQPFVVLGTAYTLQHLRSLGYRTFGGIGINETYDSILDPTMRFHAVFDIVSEIHKLPMDQLAKLHQRAKPIVEHNQQLFWKNKKSSIEQLFNSITPVD